MAKKTFGSFAAKKAEEEALVISSQPENFAALVIPIEQIRDNEENMRTYTDDPEQDSMLFEDIRANGLKQALTVFPDPNTESTFIILAGHRRFKVCKELGYDDLPCLIVSGRTQKDRLINKITSVTTNIIRRNASPLERAKEIVVLRENIRELRKLEPTYYDTGFTREILSDQTGLSVRQLSKYEKVGAHFPQEAAALAAEGNLTIEELSEVVSILKNDPGSTAHDVVTDIIVRKEKEKNDPSQAAKTVNIEKALLKKANSLRSGVKRAVEGELKLDAAGKKVLLSILEETIDLVNTMF